MPASFDDAIVTAEKALRKNPLYAGTYRRLAAALGHLGRELEAKEAMAGLLEVQLGFRISKWNAPRRWRPQLYIDGLRKAGFPE